MYEQTRSIRLVQAALLYETETSVYDYLIFHSFSVQFMRNLDFNVQRAAIT